MQVHRSSLLTDLQLRTKKKVSRRRTVHGSGAQLQISRTPVPVPATQPAPTSLTPDPVPVISSSPTNSIVVPGNQREHAALTPSAIPTPTVKSGRPTRVLSETFKLIG